MKKTYSIPFCADGDPAWEKIPCISIDVCLAEQKSDTKAWGQLCWNPDWIKVHLFAEEKEILARYTGECDPVWTDSCLEFFFCPVYEDPNYLNLECNPNGSMFFGIGVGRYDRIRLVPQQDLRELLSIKTARTENGWETFYTIPTALIRRFFPSYVPESGHMIRANLYKCGDDKTEPEYLMWSPITNGKADFHQSEFFGDLTFE